MSPPNALVMEYVEEIVEVRNAEQEKRLFAALSAQIGPQRFELWFNESRLLIEETKLVLAVKNRFFAEWIRANFLRELEQASLTTFGKSFPIDFTIDESIPEPEGSLTVSLNQQTPVPAPHRVLKGVNRPVLAAVGAERTKETGSIPDSSPMMVLASTMRSAGPLKSPIVTPQSKVGPRKFASMQSFVEGLSNRLAFRAADLAINHPGQINPIYLFGPTSVGKTHLLEGIWSAVRRHPDRKPPLYMTAEQFISGYLDSIQPSTSRGGIQSFRDKFKGISILLIDDIHSFVRKDATQTELLNTINTLRNQGVQMVFTGDRHPKELPLRQEILSRLEAGMVCGIEQPERETMFHIFRNMVQQRRLPIGPDVCRFVASRLNAHARQLSGALNRLHATYLSTGEPITLETAETTLADLIRNNRRPVRLADIEKAVCETFGLPEESLQSKSRSKQVSVPRMLAMWLARKYTRSALSEIGKYFGDRSHSTVVSAQKKVDAWVDENHPIHADELDVPVAEAIQKIERILQAS